MFFSGEFGQISRDPSGPSGMLWSIHLADFPEIFGVPFPETKKLPKLGAQVGSWEVGSFDQIQKIWAIYYKSLP